MSTSSHRPAREIDLGDVSDSRALAVARVPANSRVLDLGIGSVPVVRMLRDMGCRVWGVGADQAAVDAARDVCERVFEADLDCSDIGEVIGDQRFDVILMLDVLEHLRDPAALLRSARDMLTEHGWAVLSLLNVAPAALLEESGWQQFRVVRDTGDFNVPDLRLDGEDSELAAERQSDVDGGTDQFLVAAAPLGSPVLDRPPLLPAAIAQQALCEAATRIDELDAEIGQLHKNVLPDLMDQLDEIRGRIFEREAKLKDIPVAIGQQEERSRTPWKRLAELDARLRAESRELHAAKADALVKDEFLTSLESELDWVLSILRTKTAYIESLPWVRLRIRMRNFGRRST